MDRGIGLMGLGHMPMLLLVTPASLSGALNVHHMFATTRGRRFLFLLHRWATQGSKRKTDLLKRPLPQVSGGSRVQIQIDPTAPALKLKAILYKQEPVSE